MYHLRSCVTFLDWHSNMTPLELKALEELRRRSDIVVKPADKGGAVVVWRKDLYLQEAGRQLSNTNSYSQISRPTTKTDNTLVRKTIKTAISTGYLPPEAINAVCNEPRESNFYLMPKIHKADTPGRPIVSACSCPTVLISNTLDKIFQPIVTNLPTYIKDTNHALRLLDGFSFQDGNNSERFMFTMDIVSLYTNIPHRDGLQALKYFLQNTSSGLHVPTILRLAELVLTLNSFSFGEDHFHQTRGVAMGTKMGPSYACLFVGYVEQQALSAFQGTPPALFRRYIDDCLGVAACSRDDLLRFIKHISTYHPALQYTFDVSPTSVNFLDLTISIEPNRSTLSTSIFYKPTDSHSYLLFTSSHPPATKNSIPYSQFLRLKRICCNSSDFDEQALRMCAFFEERQYPRQTVQRALERARRVSREEALTPVERDGQEDRPVAVIPYHPHNFTISDIIRRNFHFIQSDPDLGQVFQRLPLIAFQRDKNLRDLLVRAKVSHQTNSPAPPGCSPCDEARCKTCAHINDSTIFVGPQGQFAPQSSYTCKSSDIVYILTCTLCSKLYVGETCRTLNERFTEHLRSMRLNYNDPIGQHFNSPLHTHTHAKVAAVWQNPRDRTYRKHMESQVISRLGTLQPAGINTRVTDF
ncbi:hypothetical protein ACOMHN_067667 [Nucella lapillus]